MIYSRVTPFWLGTLDLPSTTCSGRFERWRRCSIVTAWYGGRRCVGVTAWRGDGLLVLTCNCDRLTSGSRVMRNMKPDVHTFVCLSVSLCVCLSVCLSLTYSHSFPLSYLLSLFPSLFSSPFLHGGSAMGHRTPEIQN